MHTGMPYFIIQIQYLFVKLIASTPLPQLHIIDFALNVNHFHNNIIISIYAKKKAKMCVSDIACLKAWVNLV